MTAVVEFEPIVRKSQREAMAAVVAAGWNKGSVGGVAGIGFDPSQDHSYILPKLGGELHYVMERMLNPQWVEAHWEYFWSYQPLVNAVNEYFNTETSKVRNITVQVPYNGVVQELSYLDDDGISTRMCDVNACTGRTCNVQHSSICRERCSLSVTHYPDGQPVGVELPDGNVSVSLTDKRPRTNECIVYCVTNHAMSIPQAPTTDLADKVRALLHSAVKHAEFMYDANTPQQPVQTPVAPQQTSQTPAVPSFTPVAEEGNGQPVQKSEDTFVPPPPLTSKPAVASTSSGDDAQEGKDVKSATLINGVGAHAVFANMVAIIKNHVALRGISRSVNDAKKKADAGEGDINVLVLEKLRGTIKRNNLDDPRLLKMLTDAEAMFGEKKPEPKGEERVKNPNPPESKLPANQGTLANLHKMAGTDPKSAESAPITVAQSDKKSAPKATSSLSSSDADKILEAARVNQAAATMLHDSIYALIDALTTSTKGVSVPSVQPKETASAPARKKTGKRTKRSR